MTFAKSVTFELEIKILGKIFKNHKCFKYRYINVYSCRELSLLQFVKRIF